MKYRLQYDKYNIIINNKLNDCISEKKDLLLQRKVLEGKLDIVSQYINNYDEVLAKINNSTSMTTTIINLIDLNDYKYELAIKDYIYKYIYNNKELRNIERNIKKLDKYNISYNTFYKLLGVNNLILGHEVISGKTSTFAVNANNEVLCNLYCVKVDTKLRNNKPLKPNWGKSFEYMLLLFKDYDVVVFDKYNRGELTRRDLFKIAKEYKFEYHIYDTREFNIYIKMSNPKTSIYYKFAPHNKMGQFKHKTTDEVLELNDFFKITTCRGIGFVNRLMIANQYDTRLNKSYRAK